MAADHQREVEVAWAAGILDGEGCLRVNEQGNAYIAVDMTSLPPIRGLRRLFGGAITKYPLPSGRTRYRWRLGSPQVAETLRALIPYLTTKLPEAKVLLRYVEERAHTYRGSAARKRAAGKVRRRLGELKRGPRDASAGNTLHPPPGGPAKRRNNG